MRVLLFTDTLADVNGVSRFIINLAEHARATGHDLHVATSTRFACPKAANIHNLKPLAAVRMPGYPNLDLALPPWRRMLALARELKPDAIHISTPGPVGCVGRLAAKKLRVPLLGVYHTDFPAYIDRLFENELFTSISRQCMRTFYRPFTTLFPRSTDYVGAVRALGIRADILPLRPGITLDRFHPRFRDPAIWLTHGSRQPPHALRILYVGRLSIEKNMPLLAAIWRDADALLQQQNIPAELVIVGDGPFRAQLEQSLENTRTLFLGFRYNDALSRLYASSDLFLFPSVTDTLGQVVMEAQASGLPALVTDQGGPKELVVNARTGFVLPAADPAVWVRSINDLCANPTQRRVMSAEAHDHLQQFSMAASFDQWWSVHEQPLSGRASHPGRAPIVETTSACSA
ncbi:MAG TPA: glycosyltransferase family 1 protein [Phycisphaerales bacterium]|nr:glycosyltransferase family 1 protein [Phycisphaerales bacterium]